MSDTFSEKIEVKNWLPHGEQLRILLVSDHISPSEVGTILRKKGVFCADNDKPQTIPILAASILRPFEFAELLNSAISREQKIKEYPDSIPLVTASSNWGGSLKELEAEFNKFINLKGLPGITIAKTPSLHFEGKQKAVISYTINRKDMSRDLLERDTNFDATISISQHEGLLKLEVLSRNTSKETNKISEQILNGITRALKKEGIAGSEEPRRITFGSFDNKNRILFMLRLAGKITADGKPGSIVDVSIKRDEEHPSLPDDSTIKWMEGAVRNLKIDGDKLNDLSLFSEERYYEYFFLTRLAVDYSYAINQNVGECRIIYNFQIPRNNHFIGRAAFNYSIDNLSVKNSNSVKARDLVRKQLSDNIREKVDQLFDALSLPSN